MDFEYIDRCYEVEENIYDPDLLRSVIESRLDALGIKFEQSPFLREMRGDYDFVVWATYGMGPSRDIFRIAKYQVAEKILIALPAELQGIALVVVDGPFTAFDPYGSSHHSLFGSAKHTNHWTTSNPEEPIPEKYLRVLNQSEFVPSLQIRRFEAMREDCCLAVPAAKHAKYIGSRFTLRVVEDNPEQDRRILYVRGWSSGGNSYFFRQGGRCGEGRQNGLREDRRSWITPTVRRISLLAEAVGEPECMRC